MDYVSLWQQLEALVGPGFKTYFDLNFNKVSTSLEHLIKTLLISKKTVGKLKALDFQISTNFKSIGLLKIVESNLLCSRLKHIRGINKTS